MFRNPVFWVLSFLGAIILASFVFAEPASCRGMCGPDRCTMGVGCLSGCACVMPDGVNGYCARIGLTAAR